MASRHRPVAPLMVHSRPDSRASTTSATSQHQSEHAVFFAPDVKGVSQVLDGPEAALLQYQATMIPQQAAHLYTLHHMPHHIQGTALPHHAQASPSPYPMQNNFFHHDGQFPQQDQMQYPPARIGSVSVQSGGEMTDDKRRKGSAVTATNDKELREMLARNEGRPLREVAQEVIQKERTPMAEKTKQLFAMLWLRAVCKPAKTSVPRNRVYSQYANRCGTERVVPLNPASFGKLVRVIFPGIQTRRLGVRGESKYHYVDLALEDESVVNMTAPTWPNGIPHAEANSRRGESTGLQQIDFNNIPRLQADVASFPSDVSPSAPLTQKAAMDRGPASKARAFAYPDTRGMQPGPESATYRHVLRFPASSLPSFSETEAVQLPSIEPYLPGRTDHDTAEALYALYRTHCTSLIDSIRFCKEKQFFRLYASFHGTLTVPVQKLFVHPSLSPWIEQCDLVMYRTMVRFVSRLTLQAAPAVVINILSNISSTLHAHIAKTFSSHPAHVLEAKLRPATIFASLLYRLIRVNQAAHAAANLLTIDQNREQMWREWTTMVNPKRVMEAELPECGYAEVYKILTSEMRSLLEPLQAPSFQEDPYGLQAYSFDSESAQFASFTQSQNGQIDSRSQQSRISTENVLERWSSFIASLPTRFVDASARTLLHCVSAIGTAALRDITILNGSSYGHWWVLKIFVDEMALWMAEMGGFLEPVETSSLQSNETASPSPTVPTNAERSQSGSRMSSMVTDATTPPENPNHRADTHTSHPPLDGLMLQQNGHQQQQQQHPTYFNPTNHERVNFNDQHNGSSFGSHPQPLRTGTFLPGGKSTQHNENDVDDSGIGMSLMDDDMSFAKMNGNGLHGMRDGLPTEDAEINVL